MWRSRRIDGRRFFIVDGDGLPRRSNVTAIQVDAEGARPSLEVLMPWAPTLKHLIVTDYGVEDIDALKAMPNLESLALHCSPAHGDLDTARHPKLHSLAIDGRVPILLRPDSPLIDLMISKLKASSLNQLEAVGGLKHLRIDGSTIQLPRSLFRKMCQLEELDLGMLSWAGPDTDDDVPALRRLSLTRVSGLQSLRALHAHKTLESVYIEDCPDLGLPDNDLPPGTKVRLAGSNRAMK